MSTSPAEKTFDTYLVASAVTGIAMGPMTFGDIQEVWEMLLGAPVWTHELAHEPTHDAVSEECYRQFPDMPTRAEAEEDFEAARTKAEAAYGHFVTVRRGDHGRRETPLETIGAVAPHAEVVTIGK